MEIVDAAFGINENLSIVNEVRERCVVIIGKCRIHGSNNLITKSGVVVVCYSGNTGCLLILNIGGIRSKLVDTIVPR